MKADPETEAEIMAVLDRFNEAIAKKDLEMGLSTWSILNADIYLGTGADETCKGIEQIEDQLKRDHAQCDQFSWEWVWKSVSVKGDVAWVTAAHKTHIKVGWRELDLQPRTSAVLMKEEGQWKLLQLHNSLPAVNQEAGESFPALTF